MIAVANSMVELSKVMEKAGKKMVQIRLVKRYPFDKSFDEDVSEFFEWIYYSMGKEDNDAV